MLADKIQQDITVETNSAKPKRKVAASKKGKAAVELSSSKELYNYLYEACNILRRPKQFGEWEEPLERKLPALGKRTKVVFGSMV